MISWPLLASLPALPGSDQGGMGDTYSAWHLRYLVGMPSFSPGGILDSLYTAYSSLSRVSLLVPLGNLNDIFISARAAHSRK